MIYKTSQKHLCELVQALQRPERIHAAQTFEQQTMISTIVERGWLFRSDVEDLLLSMDTRLDPHGAGHPESLATLFDLPWTSVAFRPRAKASGVCLYQAMAAADVAQLLIHLECLGFRVDPEPLVSLMLPALKRAHLITTSELSIFWYARVRHRGSPMCIRHDDDLVFSMPKTRWKSVTGYRIELWLDEEDSVSELKVHSPKFRRRPEPVQVKCMDCGLVHWKGDPESIAMHRKDHRLRMTYLDPQPHDKILQARDTESMDAAERVTSSSPPWKHHEMYVRAGAFKREFGYDFVQWQSSKSDNDPNVQGILFSDEKGRIVGACAFRLCRDDHQARWGLQWVWIAPQHRRGGHLTRRWNDFRNWFGNFQVESPVSEAMRAFLAKQGDLSLIE